MGQELIERLVAALEMATKQETKAVGSRNAAQLLQQPGGLFTVTGMETDVISTHVTPKGLGAMLPVFPSEIADPRFGFLTGFSDDIGSEAVQPCDDAPTGYMKGGNLTARFGRIMRQTDTIEIDQLLLKKRGASENLRLLNSIYGSDNGRGMSMGMDQNGLLDLVVKAQMINVGVRLERKLAKILWSGSITNDTAGGGYKEFPGLDSQIATGIVDADTGTTMPAVDSLIDNFGYNAVDGSSPDIVEYLSSMMWYMEHLADRTNMTPVEFAVVMRPELWFELTAIWPCRYLTDRCSNGTSNPLVVNDDANVRMRDEMRNGMYIEINGRRYPVVIDDAITEENATTTPGSLAAGEFSSSIYIVPMRVRGNFPVLYWEHLDYSMIGTELAALGAGRGNVPFWSDNGRFLWVYRDNSYCFDIQVKTEPRVILRTPHLAARLEDVKYSPLRHLRSPYPDSAYWANGGLSYRAMSVNQSVWGNFSA